MGVRVIASAVVATILASHAQVNAEAARPGAAVSKAISACDLLTVADYQKATGAKAVYGKPELTPRGGGDSICQFDAVQFVVFWETHPRAGTSQQRLDAMLKAFKQHEQPREDVAGIGDRAFFMVPKARSQYDRAALLAFQVGPHTLALTLDIPEGRTAEAVKPQLLALARMIVAKMR